MVGPSHQDAKAWGQPCDPMRWHSGRPQPPVARIGRCLASQGLVRPRSGVRRPAAGPSGRRHCDRLGVAEIGGKMMARGITAPRLMAKPNWAGELAARVFQAMA